MTDLFALTRPLLHALNPETVHNLGLRALSGGLLLGAPALALPQLQVNAFGLTFENPVGLAAGFDKNAVAINGLLKQGFGFVEAGTVTPRAQPGNPSPRIFRLPQDRAVINRLGFNNGGLDAYVRNFAKRDKMLGIAGANIGKNKDSNDVMADYAVGLEKVYALADYVTVNISSPNTLGLRCLQQRDALTQLLHALQRTRDECIKRHGKKVPLLLKVAPDLDEKEKSDIAEVVLAYGVDALIVSNTTVSRPDALKSAGRNEQGGLSGAPLFMLSTSVLKEFYKLTGGKLPLIGAGGISSAEDAYTKIRNGATLLQLYTVLVYRGFAVVREIQAGLAELLRKDGFPNVQAAVGVDAR